MHSPGRQPQGPITSQRMRLGARNSAPKQEDIAALLEEAGHVRGKTLEQPFVLSGQGKAFLLTVKLEPGAETPTWALHHGETAESEVVWSLTDKDVPLVCDVLSMFMLEPAPTASEKGAKGELKEASRHPGFFESISNQDFERLKQTPNILLGHLLVEAGLLPEPVLDEALRLQELVRNESLTAMQAVSALRKAYCQTSVETRKPAPSTAPASAAGEKSGYDQAEIRLSVDLLKQAGLISEDDLKIALAVKKKHGGELDSILVTAGKISDKTMAAAHTCWPMVRDGLIKPEQAIIALHYCERSRVSFTEAVSELGWEI